jgi:membrane-anchored protein YejM (alkaline phosphatase superfamily)
MLYLLYYLLFRPFFRFSKVVTPLLTALFILTNFALVLDFFIFRIWKFHINAMVLNILFSPAAFDSIQTGTGPVIVGVAYFVLMLLFELWLLKFLKSKEASLPAWNRLFNRRVAPLILLVALSEKIYYGIAYMRADDRILESTKPIPLYQPLTFSRFASKYLGIEKVERDEPKVGIKKDAKVRYPLEAIRIPHPRPTHIFIFGSDAVRADMVDAAVMPNIAHFAKEAIFFKENRSGGNATRFGLFSFFYGLNAPYWFAFLNAKKGPVLFDVLKRLDYEIGIYYSTDTRWPEFRQTVFYQVRDKIHDKMPGNPWQKDAELTKRWTAWIENLDGSKPIFSFVFLDAPHGRYYPKDEAIFQPDGGGKVNYTTTSEKDRVELFNQYKNAIHYDDRLLGKMLALLKKKGLYEKSVVVFMSDHGEEFYEHGHFSHNNAFDKEQTNACLIVKLPGGKPKVVEKLASAIDFIPSLLKYLGVANDLATFSNAREMFDEGYVRPYATCGSWYKNAIITPKFTYVFSTLPNELFKTKIYDTRTYRRLKSVDDPNKSRYIMEVLDENRRFIR